ncbi:uncharacterized protein EHS24_007641 [Apiotrichum porosum]|uniref:RRM domain-containing protein n=1 Tax=Apiotrichum porosum TaxID=105984 RepID=A0A427XUV6_9TREE|nr:uncharacterized protein EHS24_007641 [Apiotrichum porosum]RSH82648.1 hypothetical protein EHS24_007641 [Apiotrichum porosum]
MPSVLLFSGLPLDVREPDLAELLTADPTRLPAASVAVTALHNSAGKFLGTFLVEVGSDADAERVRLQYSGQVIDGSHSLAVHHVLPKTHAHPSVAPPKSVAQRIIPKLGAPAKPAQLAMQQAQQQQQQGGRQQGRKAAAGGSSGAEAKPPGIQLLSRLGKAGKAGEKERQKLLKKPSTPGDALLSRLAKTKATQKASPTKTAGGGGGRAKPPTPSAASKAKAKTKKTGAGRGAGAAKVARAKADAGGKMDVDRPAVGNVKSQAQPQAPAQPQVKTQAQLDEEMRAYERARRFGA